MFKWLFLQTYNNGIKKAVYTKIELFDSDPRHAYTYITILYIYCTR